MTQARRTRNRWRVIGAVFTLVACGALALAGHVLATVIIGAACVAVVVRAEHDTNIGGR